MATARGWFARCDAITQQSFVVGIVGVITMVGLQSIPGTFRTNRTNLVVAATVIIAVGTLWSVAVRQSNRQRVWIWCLLALTAQSLVGVSTLSPGLIICCGMTTGVIVVTAATHLGRGEVAVVAVLAEAAMAITVVGIGMNGLAVPLILMTAGVLAAAPALAVLDYRHQLEQAIGRANRLALHDELTGLLNRHGLSNGAGALVSRAARQGDLVGVLVADVDRFKKVNDEHGHAVGDTVLRHVGEALLAVARTEDLTARLGGEEFCLVVILAEIAELAVLGERMRLAVAGAQGPLPVTVSVGGACTRPISGGPAPEQLVLGLTSQADVLLYEAKQSGRNRVRTPDGQADGGAKNSRAMSSGSSKDSPEP